MVNALLIPVEGEPTKIQAGDYKHLQSLVGGIIEGIHFGEDAFAYINEEGKLIGLELNEFATLLFQLQHNTADFICGPMVMVGPADDDGNDTDLAEASILSTITVYRRLAGNGL